MAWRKLEAPFSQLSPVRRYVSLSVSSQRIFFYLEYLALLLSPHRTAQSTLSAAGGACISDTRALKSNFGPFARTVRGTALDSVGALTITQGFETTAVVQAARSAAGTDKKVALLSGFESCLQTSPPDFSRW